MSIEITSVTDQYLTVKITGKLKPSELRTLQQAARDYIQAKGKGSALILANEFEGFAGGQWDHPSIQPDFDAGIDRIAIVGKDQWEELTLIFVAKGVRQLNLEYFAPEEETKARAWLVLGK